jgi:hypothetical protein
MSWKTLRISSAFDITFGRFHRQRPKTGLVLVKFERGLRLEQAV